MISRYSCALISNKKGIQVTLSPPSISSPLYLLRNHRKHHFQSTHRVPNLKLDLFPLNVDHPSPELDSNGEVVHRLEPLVRELEQQAGLAHP